MLAMAPGVPGDEELLRPSRGGGTQEAGALLLGDVLGARRCDAAPPLLPRALMEPVMRTSPVAGVRAPARSLISIIITIAIVLSRLEVMELMLKVQALRMGVCCWRSAAAVGGALGFFMFAARCCRTTVATTASLSTATAGTSFSSFDPMGRLSAMATTPRTEPPPATTSVVAKSVTGTLSRSTSGPRWMILLGTSWLASTA